MVIQPMTIMNDVSDLKQLKIFVAGDQGMVGSAIVRRLQKAGYRNILTRSRDALDLVDQASVTKFFMAERPDYVFLAAAKVGGIGANSTYPAAFIYQNLMIQTNVIHAAWKSGVTRLLFLGSSCIYPRDSQQPIHEEGLLTGPLEQTNESYAVAKIAGIKLCESYNRQYGTQYVSVMPTNLYGPNDNYDLDNSHVVPALIRKAHEAKVNNKKSLGVWGSGKQMREFLYVDDMADACVFVMESGIANGVFNIGIGEDITISKLVEVICKIVGFNGEVVFDTSKPDGTPRKLLNIDRLKAKGWLATTSLESGIKKAYLDFLAQHV